MTLLTQVHDSTSFVVSVGSRGGAWLALLLFAGMFLVLGAVTMRAMRKRSVGVKPALIVGALLFAAPTLLVYSSSLSGFYDVKIVGASASLSWLFPFGGKTIKASDVHMVQPLHAFKGRWRVHIQTKSGGVFGSAQTGHAPATAAADRIRAWSLRLPTRYAGRDAEALSPRRRPGSM